MPMINVIRNDTDHERAVARVREIWDAPDDSPESEELGLLAMVIDAYERKRWPIGPSDPIDMIRFYLEQNGLRQKDLAAVIGSESRASEVMNRKRPLTVEMIRSIAAAWRLPVGLLIGESLKVAS
jgi:HTH-type transcriptional regulator/antitoxin HigA